MFLRLSAMLLLGYATAPRAIPTWDELQSAYAPIEAPFEVREQAVEMGEKMLRTRISFPSQSGDTVTGVFVRPRAEGVYPVVLLLHGLGGNREQAIGSAARLLIRQGIACLALDAPHHGERRTSADHSLWLRMYSELGSEEHGINDLAAKVLRQEDDGAVAKLLQDTIKTGVMDYRRALDYLGTRKDVDKNRIGLMGFSMGAMMGTILGAVDSRVKALSLCVGGDPYTRFMQSRSPEEQMTLACISPSFFAPHVAPRPVLMLNGRNDDTIPRSAAEVLYYSAREPKQIRWYNSGHRLPDKAFVEAAEWLKNRL
ncbi:MAG: alpha/beta hydrolase [Armatimonadetes bacterium]|nr:alpha/beta hydrolase [Armatimonadota bacterium]